MKLLTQLAAMSMGWCQSPHTTNIAPSSLKFYSFSQVNAPTPPFGAQLLLTYPNQTSGSINSIPGCSTFNELRYAHYTYDIGTATWSGPATGNNIASNPTMFYESLSPSKKWAGFKADISMTGKLATNTSPSTQNFIQAVYFSTDACYEYGPEYGFYRLLINPGNSSEEGTVYFYYGDNVNCYNVPPLGSCRDKTTGASLTYNVVTQAITPPATNSRGGTNFIYGAYVSSPTNWHITVVDPYTGLDAVPPINLTIDGGGFYGGIAKSSFYTGLTGYFTVTQQRTGAVGNITQSDAYPLKTLMYGAKQVKIYD